MKSLYYIGCLLISLLFIASTITASQTYTPVIFVHGLTGHASRFDFVRERLEKQRPGIITESIAFYEGPASVFHSLDQELELVKAEIAKVKKEKNIDKHHLVCHSMGALLCRAYLMRYEHSVVNFISTSGMQMGQFGLTSKFEKFAPKVLTHLTRDNVYLFIYENYIQDYFSISGFWKDPIRSHYDAYLRKCKFLPLYNGDVFNPKAEQWKQNFLKINKFIASGCTTDEVLQPQLSSVFSYYALTDSQENLVVQDYTHQNVYTNDTFGLKTMMDAGRASLNVVQGCLHDDWYREGKLFDEYVTKYLD